MVSSLTLYLALRDLSLREIGSLVSDANGLFLGLGLAALVLSWWIKALRWQVLMLPMAEAVPFRQILAAHLAGQMLNLVYPARAGDLSRAFALGKTGLGKPFILGTVALEKLWDLLFYGLMLGALLVLVPLPAWVSRSAYALLGVTLICGTLAVLLAYRQPQARLLWQRLGRRLPERYRLLSAGWLENGLASLDIVRNGRKGLVLAALTAVNWATGIFQCYCTGLALGLHLPFAAILLILVALQAGIIVPSVPGRVGVFQYICQIALAAFGIGQATGFSYGVLLYAFSLLPVMAFGLAAIWLLGRWV